MLGIFALVFPVVVVVTLIATIALTGKVVE